MQPSELVALLRRQILRVRTGLWLISPNLLGDEHNEAVRLGVAGVDMRELLLGELPVDTAFVMLNADRVIQLLGQVAGQSHFGNCALVYNLDLLLARLTVLQRVDAWNSILDGIPHRLRNVPRDCEVRAIVWPLCAERRPSMALPRAF